MRPELSVAEGWDHVTCEDVVPLSAVATICDGQFENTGAETSVKEKNIYLKKHTQQQDEYIYIHTSHYWFLTVLANHHHKQLQRQNYHVLYPSLSLIIPLPLLLLIPPVFLLPLSLVIFLMFPLANIVVIIKNNDYDNYIKLVPTFAPWISQWRPVLMLVTSLQPRPMVLISALACESAIICVRNEGACIGAERGGNV